MLLALGLQEQQLLVPQRKQSLQLGHLGLRRGELALRGVRRAHPRRCCLAGLAVGRRRLAGRGGR